MDVLEQNDIVELREAVNVKNGCKASIDVIDGCRETITRIIARKVCNKWKRYIVQNSVHMRSFSIN
jgi:hypothetical protein